MRETERQRQNSELRTLLLKDRDRETERGYTAYPVEGEEQPKSVHKPPTVRPLVVHVKHICIKYFRVGHLKVINHVPDLYMNKWLFFNHEYSGTLMKDRPDEKPSPFKHQLTN